MPPVLYFGLSFIIAVFGINRKFGFWGYLFGSLLLTPVIGFLLVVSSDKRKKPEIIPTKPDKKNKNKNKKADTALLTNEPQSQ
jgi:hypothetical protein